MDITRIKTALSRLMRKKWVWFLLIIAGFWTASHVWDYYKLLSGQTPMYDVAIKLKVGDELVEINRTVPCLEIPQGEALPYLVKPSKWFKRPFRYFSRDMSTGAELEDGRGVMVTIPTVCDLVQKAEKEKAEGNVMPDGFMPMVALLDNADDPQVVKLIASRSYYRRDDREVDLLEYDITPSPKWAFPSFMDKFNWLRSFDPASAKIGNSKKMYFKRGFLMGMPLEMFRMNNPENVPVDGLKEPTSLFDIPGFKYPEDLTLPRIPGFGLFGLPFFSVDQQRWAFEEQTSYDHVIPIFQTSEGNTYDTDQQGYLMLYRSSGGSSRPGEIIEWSDDKKSIVSRRNIYEYELMKDGKKLPMTTETLRF
ncbi:MAG: hypothetical protein CMN56_09870 [Sneathiella sp.]|uniref:hypothetical protein n=1 Tax=Sneathiella sp. TaxID=1964365 RepID=UPI000C430984|nr:hypothetical protein [Sneathiella sp.]MAZ03433.1 hypothetical protein [Sneathiella sp.]